MPTVDLQCKYCLAQLKVIGKNHYRCESCGNKSDPVNAFYSYSK